MEAARKGNWSQTFTGKAFYAFDPRPEDVDARDIAHALANICRFGGHVKSFYSVAQHSFHCSELVPWQFALQALLHDASEAYIGDMISPIKMLVPDYYKVEADIQRVIGETFGVDLVNLSLETMNADAVMLKTEARDLLEKPPTLWDRTAHEPRAERIVPWDPVYAEKAFLLRLEQLRR